MVPHRDRLLCSDAYGGEEVGRSSMHSAQSYHSCSRMGLASPAAVRLQIETLGAELGVAAFGAICSETAETGYQVGCVLTHLCSPWPSVLALHTCGTRHC